MPADPLAAAARDLAALAGADRRAILAGLDALDRERMLAALRGQLPPPRPAAPGLYSDWCERLIAAARDDDPAMTRAARAALLEARSLTGPATRQPGRTLLQAAGGLLAAGMSR